MAKEKDNFEESSNRFEKEQPLRHPMAAVAMDEDKLKINKQLYRILANKRDAIDLDLLRKKYDPYLDQYDFIVGDISSDHLRFKGFYKDNVRTAIDRKQRAIVDYLTEYCNPGTAYFVLQLISPVHHHTVGNNDKPQNKRRHYSNKNKTHIKNNFKKRRVHKTKFPRKKTVAVQKGKGRNHSFVIKKRKEQ